MLTRKDAAERLGRAVVFLLLCVSGAQAADHKLWELGGDVNDNPVTVFAMFTFTVLLSIVIETAKHSTEHHTHDPHRRQALSAVYSELMMIGVVSFLLILVAEVGLTDIKIKKPGCTPSEDASSGSAAAHTPALAAPHARHLDTIKRAASVLSDEHPPLPPPVWRDLPEPAPGGYAAPRRPADAANPGQGGAAAASGGLPSYAVGDDREPRWSGDEQQPPPRSGGDRRMWADVLANRKPRHAAVLSAHSGSGSDADECFFTFDLLMFEYAHLVLFFMGISYGVFIQSAFWQRNRLVKKLDEDQKMPLANLCAPHFQVPSKLGIMGFLDNESWIRCILCLRAAMLIKNMDTIRKICDPEEVELEVRLAILKGSDPPRERAVSPNGPFYFDISKFSHVAISDVLVELLHVPAVVWVSVIVMSAFNLVHVAGMSLSVTILIFAFLGPMMATFLLFRMAGQLQRIITDAIGHPDIDAYPFYKAVKIGSSPPNEVKVSEAMSRYGMEWSRGGDDAWGSLIGCCEDDHPLNFMDLNDPGSLEIQIQIVIYATCFFVGQLIMLSSFIYDDLGAGALVVCWIFPMIPLVILIPRCLFLYVFTHRTHKPRRSWLVDSVCLLSPEEDRHKLKHHLGSDTHEYLTELLVRTKRSEATDDHPTMNTSVAPAGSQFNDSMRSKAAMSSTQPVYYAAYPPHVNSQGYYGIGSLPTGTSPGGAGGNYGRAAPGELAASPYNPPKRNSGWRQSIGDGLAPLIAQPPTDYDADLPGIRSPDGQQDNANGGSRSQRAGNSPWNKSYRYRDSVPDPSLVLKEGDRSRSRPRPLPKDLSELNGGGNPMAPGSEARDGISPTSF
ncbi:hypothetical protein DIPPA_06427 [Diplonema papillatum]|nr:hypothetical protein DIPPA_06427 [Diplonema papillatum]